MTRGLLVIAIGIAIAGHAHWGCAACRFCEVHSSTDVSLHLDGDDCDGHHHRQSHDNRHAPGLPCSPAGPCAYFLSRVAGSDLCFLMSHLSPPMQAASCDALIGPSSPISSIVVIDYGALRLAMQQSRLRVLLL